MNGALPLPTVLAEIADAAGIDAAIDLARAYGGQTVYVPSRPKPDHWLVDTVGREAAEKICDHYRVRDSGARLLIPLARPSLLAAVLARGASPVAPPLRSASTNAPLTGCAPGCGGTAILSPAPNRRAHRNPENAPHDGRLAPTTGYCSGRNRVGDQLVHAVAHIQK